VNAIDIIFPILMMLTLYLLFIKPQADEKAKHEDLLQKLAKDDWIVTGSGIHGRIVEVGDDIVVVDIGDKTRITLDKVAVARKQAAGDTK
jgi:preprotein translocase subunit YajC